MQLALNPLIESKKAEHDAALAFTLSMSPKQREVKYYRRESAAEAIGELSPGLDRYIFSKGQFSVIEFLYSLTEQTGPVHSLISTWTAAGSDIAEAHSFIKSGRLLSSRWIVDFTFQRRKPAFCGQLRELFGLDAIRVTSTHAKFVCLWNDRWNVMLFTSANLNGNPRNENFLIRESKELVDFHREYADGLFRTQTKEEMLEHEAFKHRARFNED
jgi:hypothetical protein